MLRQRSFAHCLVAAAGALVLGVDQLLGPDAQHWVYQHKPWFGILFGLDLN